MRRRTFVAAGIAAIFGGCSGDSTSDDTNEESEPATTSEPFWPTENKNTNSPIHTALERARADETPAPTESGGPTLELQRPPSEPVEWDDTVHRVAPEITNTGDVPAGHVNLDVTWYYESGDIDESASAGTPSLSLLEPGETWKPELRAVDDDGARIDDYELEASTGAIPTAPDFVELVESELIPIESFPGGDPVITIHAEVANRSADKDPYTEAFGKIIDDQGRVITDDQSITRSLSADETWSPSFSFPLLSREDRVAEHELVLDVSEGI